MHEETPIITSGEGEIHIRTDKEVNAKFLNEALLTLPAKTYLELHREVHIKIYGYPPLSVYGGCCGSFGNKEESNG